MTDREKAQAVIEEALMWHELVPNSTSPSFLDFERAHNATAAHILKHLEQEGFEIVRKE